MSNIDNKLIKINAYSNKLFNLALKKYLALKKLEKNNISNIDKMKAKYYMFRMKSCFEKLPKENQRQVSKNVSEGTLDFNYIIRECTCVSLRLGDCMRGIEHFHTLTSDDLK